MRVRVYQSDKGDCVLVSGRAGGHVLVDGGMRQAFKDHVRADLAKLTAQKEALDLVCVSHIDQDHISGVLELLDEIMVWRVFEFRRKQKAKVKSPAFPKPPDVKEIWHNAFADVLKNNAGSVEQLLAQSSLVLGLSSDQPLRLLAQEHHELAYSVSEAIQVSQRISATQLNIPLNRPFGGKLIMTRSPAKRAARIAKIDAFVVGPLPSEVKRVRDEWDAWLRRNRDKVRKLKQQAEGDARSIGNSADRIAELLATRVDGLGDRESVTAPNLASVMLLLKEGSKKVLLTGDGHWEDVLKGLKHHGMLDANGKLHVDVLKVQHHGSEHNYDAEMAERVTARNYVFCGNGKHENPDVRVVDLICDSHRRARPADTFTLWFNCAPTVAPAGKPQKHMKAVKRAVDAQIAASEGNIRANYLAKAFFDISP